MGPEVFKNSISPTQAPLPSSVTAGLPLVAPVAGISRCHFDTIDSTSTFAKTVAGLPARGCLCITASCQRAGRGQRGNTFFSRRPGGLWMSLIWPCPDLGRHFDLNRALLLALVQTLAIHGPDLDFRIKWPNDIYVNGRKICGILLESTPASASHLVLGVGCNINLGEDDFPLPLRAHATSLRVETGHDGDLETFLAVCLKTFCQNLGGDPDTAHTRYCAVLLGRGRQVRVGSVPGTFDGVEKDGRLRLVTDEGVRHLFTGPLRFIDGATEGGWV